MAPLDWPRVLTGLGLNSVLNLVGLALVVTVLVIAGPAFGVARHWRTATRVVVYAATPLFVAGFLRILIAVPHLWHCAGTVFVSVALYASFLLGSAMVRVLQPAERREQAFVILGLLTFWAVLALCAWLPSVALLADWLAITPRPA
jgi:hypothetical protein